MSQAPMSYGKLIMDLILPTNKEALGHNESMSSATYKPIKKNNNK